MNVNLSTSQRAPALRCVVTHKTYVVSHKKNTKNNFAKYRSEKRD